MTLFKVFAVIWWRGRKQYVRLALHHDRDWRRHWRKSWRKRRYYVQGQGHRRAYRAQWLDLVLVWRIGRK